MIEAPGIGVVVDFAVGAGAAAAVLLVDAIADLAGRRRWADALVPPLPFVGTLAATGYAPPVE